MIPCHRTHSSGHQINKLIQEKYKIWVLVAWAYSYVAHLRPNHGAKTGKQVTSSTKWWLGENIVLRLMEYLTPVFSFDIFMDYYFTSFRLLIHLGVNNILATGVLNKNRLHKWQMHNHWKQTAAKKEAFHFEQRTSSKKAVYLWLEQQ